jgi:hypothetical protein
LHEYILSYFAKHCLVARIIQAIDAAIERIRKPFGFRLKKYTKANFAKNCNLIVRAITL